MKTFIKAVIVIALTIIVLYCINIISSPNMTPKESGLTAILLTIFSVLASWFISHLYSEHQTVNQINVIEEQHKEKLKTYALKAAEKVDNLSSELYRLTTYLEHELNCNNYDSPDEALNAKQERIESAIHIIRTLKSMNDTSLSDWQGVIGDELSIRKQQREEKEEEVEAIIEQVGTIISNPSSQNVNTNIDINPDDALLLSKLESLKMELANAASQLTGVGIRHSKRGGKTQRVDGICPSCHNNYIYYHRYLPGNKKAVTCSECRSKLISICNQDNYELIPREREDLNTTCPNCKSDISISLDKMPGSYEEFNCKNCAAHIRAYRNATDVVIKLVEPKTSMPANDKRISVEIINLIKKELPEQPWPTGIHKQIAEKLGISNALASKAISQLIEDGELIT